MAVFTVHEAKTHLSRLIADALAGEEVVIARGTVPVVRLVPADPPKKKKPLLGALEGKISFDESFYDPLPEEELAAWNGETD